MTNRAVSIIGVCEDLYALTVEQVDAEISELNRRLTLLSSLRTVIAGDTGLTIPPLPPVTPETPPTAAAKPPTKRKAPYIPPTREPDPDDEDETGDFVPVVPCDGRSASYLSDEELTAIKRKVEECLITNGALTFNEVVKKTRLNPAQTKRGLASSRISQGADKRYRLLNV